MDNRDNSHLIPNQRERYPQPGRDNSGQNLPGYDIVDSGRVINPQENQWQKGNEKADYDAAVGRVTHWNADNFQGAYDAAAKKGTGVIFIVGSQSTRDTQATLKNMEALKAKNPDAEIVYLDKDKIATDPRYEGLRQWVQKNTNNDNLSFMAQYGVRPGKNGVPEGSNLVSTHWGSDAEGVAQQMQFAKMSTERHKGQFKIPEGQPEIRPQPNPETKPTIPETPQQATIREADAIDQKAVSAELDQVNAAIAEAQNVGEAGAKVLPQLQDRQKKLQSMREAPARSRKEYAQKLFADANALSGKTDDQSKEQAEGLALQGHRQINEANAKVPGYFNNDAARQELKAMGYSDKGIESLNNPAATGANSKHWLGENLYGMSEAEKTKLYANGGDEQGLKDAQRDILEAAIADAKAKGVPLVIKYGMQGCQPCVAMDRDAMAETAKGLQGKAVVAAVDGPYAAEVLKEHGYSLQVRSFPAVEGFDVSNAGNLTHPASAKLEGVALTSYTEGKGFDGTPSKTAIPQMVELMRLERAERARQAAVEVEEQIMERLNRELRERKIYQFSGDTPVSKL